MKTILVVEDEPEIGMLIRRSLVMKNFNVIEVKTATHALDILQSQKPDLILLDVMMPDMDGFELCQRIKENPKQKNVPVVFLTVRNNREDAARGKAVGATLYLTKPFDPFKLGDEVEKLLQ